MDSEIDFWLLHFEKQADGTTRWVTTKELHRRGLVSDAYYEQHVRAMKRMEEQLANPEPPGQ